MRKPDHKEPNRITNQPKNLCTSQQSVSYHANECKPFHTSSLPFPHPPPLFPSPKKQKKIEECKIHLTWAVSDLITSFAALHLAVSSPAMVIASFSCLVVLSSSTS